MPIKALNQFCSDWCIKARITKKNDMRNWKNARGEGHLITINLIDREGTQIQGTCFNETARKFDAELEENCVYTFENGQVKLANKRYTSIKNDYCLTFDQNTVVKKCEEDAGITDSGYSFSSLDQIEAMVQQATVDVIGIVLDVQPTSSITLRDGSQKDRRTITIGDDNNMMIGVTVWGENCNRFDLKVGQVVAFRECKVSEYRGKSLNASSAAQDIIIEPRHSKTKKLRNWQENQGSLSNMKESMRALGDMGTGTGEQRRDACVLISEMQ